MPGSPQVAAAPAPRGGPASRRAPGAELAGSFRLVMLWLDSPRPGQSGLLEVRAPERGQARCRLTLPLDGGGELVLPGHVLSLARAWQFLFPSRTGILCSIVAEAPESSPAGDVLRGAILLGDLHGCQGIGSGRCLLERVALEPSPDETVGVNPFDRSIRSEGHTSSSARRAQQFFG